MRVALDSNVLLYAEGIDDAARRDAAIDIISRLQHADVVLPVQAVGELFNVLVRRGGRSRGEAYDRCRWWIDSYETMDTTPDILSNAAAFAAHHAFSIWDSVILQTAVSAGCRLLLSEDMQHGFSWHGVTIVDPFAKPIHPILLGVLAS